MKSKKAIVPVLLIVFLLICACQYIVLPEGIETKKADENLENSGWVGIVTGVSELQAGSLHVDITIRNDLGQWSSMRAVDDQPAVLTTADGTAKNCDTVFVSTGGHRLPPGFQIRGYTVENDGQTQIQPIYVECEGGTPEAGSKLTIDYIHFDGEVDYYVEIEESNKIEETMELNLDEVVTDLVYPFAEAKEGLIKAPDTEFIGLSENIVKLLGVERTGDGFEFNWQNSNPSKFALKTHIGIPPVVGEDGNLYGLYETLDIPEVPLTPAEKSVEWTTAVAVPGDVAGFYILLSVESKKPRTYSNYVIDITDK